MTLTKHESSGRESLARGRDLFDRFFEDRPSLLRRPFLVWPETDGEMRVEEFREDGELVLRVELAGIDPDKDVEISVADQMLHIEAERREEETKQGRDYLRREFRYGSFVRDLPLPIGVGEMDVKATYKDGILEVRVPMPESKPAAKVAITKS